MIEWRKRYFGGNMNTILILIGLLLVLDTVFILGRSNVNMGVLMPAIMGFPLLIMGMLYEQTAAWMQGGIGAWVKWIMILCYAGYLLLVAVCSLLIVREIRAEIPNDADAVIVLGAGVHGTKPSLALQHRLEIAAEYLGKNADAVAIVSGGQGPQEHITEAEAMYRYMLELGIEESRILREDAARSTYENFLFSKEILERRFPEGYSVVFATNDFHIFRAKIAAKKAGFGDIRGMGCPSPFYIVPNYYMREAMAIVRYVLLGLR